MNKQIAQEQAFATYVPNVVASLSRLDEITQMWAYGPRVTFFPPNRNRDGGKSWFNQIGRFGKD